MKQILLFTALLLVLVGQNNVFAETVYQTPDDFLQEVFGGDPPEPQVLSIFGERKKTVATILTHPPAKLRTRYWKDGDKTVWILDEIGKTKPITAGLVVEAGALKDLRVLIYRSSRGADVRQPTFTKQFHGAKLNSEKQLNVSVDGVSGASFSVRAMKRLVALALFLDEELKIQ
ncbi:FMN-binding protein [Oligoflexia bacterium]|nr:FMN-binding protein [Oligoflexia bacterium]